MFEKKTIIQFGFYFLIVLVLLFIFNYIKNNTNFKQQESFENVEKEEVIQEELEKPLVDEFENTNKELEGKNFLNAGFHSNINSKNKKTENLQLRAEPQIERKTTNPSMERR